MSARGICIELDAAGAVTTILDGEDARATPGVVVHGDGPLLVAVPGVVADGRVLASAALGWIDVDPAAELGLPRPATLVRNRSEAAAAGEAALGAGDDFLYLDLGGDVEGALVRDGEVVVGEIAGHDGGFGDAACLCGKTGCLATLTARWALGESPSAKALEVAADAIAAALGEDWVGARAVLGGDLVRQHPVVVERVARAVRGTEILVSRAPDGFRSAAPWGLFRLARARA